MSESRSDQVKSVIGAGLKATSITSSVVQLGTQVLSQLCSSTKSKLFERQQPLKENGSTNAKKSCSSVVSHVQDVLQIVKPAVQIAITLHNAYKAVHPSKSVNSNYTPCYSKSQTEECCGKVAKCSANLGVFETGGPVSQKQKNLKKSTKKELQSENEPRCDICRARSNVRQLGISPCQHIFCYNCLKIVTKCTVCEKPFRREDFQRLS